MLKERACLMNYPGIFDPIPWNEVGLSILQTLTIFWLILLGLKLVGRRVFGELGPQDLIVLLLIAEASDLGLTHQDAGYWGALASILTILTTGALIEHLPLLRHFLEEEGIVLLRSGEPDEQTMKKNLVQREDLEKTARQYGFAELEAFDAMVLESDGKITGVLKPEFRDPDRAARSIEN
jgi:uncharacterized membrane protein YcaP (DUF421 family)